MLPFVADDGGRQNSGRRGSADDCVVRALAIVAEYDYDAVYKDVAEAVYVATGRRSARDGVPKKVRDRVYANYGLVKLPREFGRRPSLTEVARKHPRAIVSTVRHVMAIVDGALHDTHDCRLSYMPDGTSHERRAMSVLVTNNR